ncbi:2-polyprenyl-6-methoxyphenol hydroxylase [Legionella nautarum]|uniref:2-polyprenyl-6-methoxyphenol hydroxylase n=1 Tax=Legionella nautarum TaxID=45070 RepID=A0A0W0WWF3_9GAMM|nr:FAD-dependent oxidoreductase [Legionella nautarum]KTD36550.1 2-polyprenyl-6-methoxyphenol hydroxylase [Legionella nautarum]
MSQQFDVVVIGGGVVGLTAALAMQSRGFSVAIIDAGNLTANTTIPDPRVYAINQASQDLLQELGVWAHLDSERLSPYRQMYVWDAASNAHIQFDARMIASDHLGTIMEESVLKQALLRLLNEKVVFFANHRVSGLESYKDFIQISTGETSWQAQLLMIADGATSPCRELLRVPLTTWPYHQQAVVASVQTEKSHQQTAYQVFNADGPLAFLPLTQEQQCSIVWSTSTAHAQRVMALSDEDFNQELEAAFASRLGKVKVMGKRYQFPLIMRHAKQYSGERWLLLGDAAHTIHPLAGLGLNVGLADVATWLACSEKLTTLSAVKKILGSYQRQRKYAVWQVIAMMDGFKSLFTNPLAPVIALRGLGLRICNGLTPLKRIFIEQAAGK